MSIYKSCDIRGRAADRADAGTVWSWGYTLGMGPAAGQVRGGWRRARLHAGVSRRLGSDGLAAAGVDCIDLGQLPTPMIYYARRRLNAAGCAVVTASHNAAAINGLKWMVGQRPPGPEEVERLRMESERPAGADPARQPTVPRRWTSPSTTWPGCKRCGIESLRATLTWCSIPCTAAGQPGPGATCNAIFPECLLLGIHDWRDPEFDGRIPDCSHADNLHELCEAVYRHHADLGIAFDGDGNRIALVDNEGDGPDGGRSDLGSAGLLRVGIAGAAIRPRSEVFRPHSRGGRRPGRRAAGGAERARLHPRRMRQTDARFALK